MMQTTADDAAWIAKYQPIVERLRLREAAAKAGASAQEVAGSGVVVQESGPAEALPGVAGLEVPGASGLEPGSTVTT
jgi:hypothetical protein